MGYTHYWYRQPELDRLAFYKFGQDVTDLLNALPPSTTSAGGYYANAPLLIANWNGDMNSLPKISPDEVSFNGTGRDEDGEELDHETFLIERVFHPAPYEYLREDGTYFTFCKTARKPYDLLVTAALIRFKHHFPDVQIDSDGYAEEWEEGMKLCQAVFGEASLPFTKSKYNAA